MTRKRRPNPNVVANGVKDRQVTIAEDDVDVVASLDGHAVVFDHDSWEVRCVCHEFARSPGSPKLCQHVIALVVAGVLRRGHRWNAGGVVQAVLARNGNKEAT